MCATRFFSLLLVLLLSSQALAKESLEQYEIAEFPEEFRFQMNRGGDSVRHRFSELLFDSINDLKVYDFSKGHTSFGLRVGRAVYDNHDVSQSYTVVDRMMLPITLYGYSIPIAGTNLYFSLGVGGGLQLTNLRQVTRSSFGELSSVEERADGVTKSEWWKEAKVPEDQENPPYAEAPPEPEGSLFRLDSLNSARYREFWNQLSFPARLPFKADWIKRMDVGEVMSYGGEGYIELGMGFSAVTNALDIQRFIDTMGLSAEYKYFIRGEYRIAIYRETEHHVKVKVTRREDRGTRASLGAESRRVHWFDGFTVFGRDMGRWGGGTVVPFNFQREDSKGTVVEEGFRFDLRNEAAKEAYELAVLGRFAKADEVATREIARGVAESNAAVVRIFRKDSKEERERHSRGLKILLIYKQDRSSEQRNQDADLVLKDGKHKVYSSIVENRFESKLFFGSREKSITRATIDVSDALMSISLEGWIEDSRTSAYELEDYQRVAENAIARGEIFPRMPDVAPPKAEKKSFNEGFTDEQAVVLDYGPSSFYWRVDANSEQIQKFIHTPSEDKWRVLAKVFGVEEGRWDTPGRRTANRIFGYLGRAINVLLIPVDLRFRDLESLIIAEAIIENWESLATYKDPFELTKALGRQFADVIYGHEMLQVFTNALVNDGLSFYLAASNQGFGRVNVQEGSFAGVGQTLEEYRRTANIENPERGQNIQLTVGDLQAEVLDENRVLVRFSFNVKPNFVYFRVDNTDFFRGTNAELVVVNIGQFQAGRNELILDKREKNYRGILARAFKKGPDFFEIFLGAGLSRREWGPVSGSKVWYPYSPLKPE